VHVLRTAIRVGQQVHARGEPWVVVDTDRFDDCTVVTLRGIGDDNLFSTSRLLTPFDRIEISYNRRRIRRAKERTVARVAAAAVAWTHGWTDPWTAATAKIDLLPWQFEPALAAVAGATRLLLTDEVGLGKTIQSGLIVSELRARNLITRTLVLTPASLREQWATELRTRFALDAIVIDQTALTRMVAALPVGVNPWSTSHLIVSSIDLVKRPEVRAGLDGLPFDLLIVDEAHHLKPGTDRGAVAMELAARVPWVVLVTATPHFGDDHAYSFLRNLGAVGSQSPLRIFRRTGHAIGRRHDRRERYQAVAASRLEQQLLDETWAYARALWKRRAPAERHGAILAAIICRRAVSSSHSLVRTLCRRSQLLQGEDASDAIQELLPWLEEERDDDLEPDDIVGSSRLEDVQEELRTLDRLIRLAASLSGESSKRRMIERFIDRTNESLLLFSEYRDTLGYLEEALRHRTSIAVLHGGMSSRERRDAVRRFVSGDARVLLATDAAGEGLNLQQRCRLIINVELPWNPLRLEQRIGRVDRLGQARRVHAVHLVYRGTFEDEVLARLQEKMRRAETRLAHGGPDEYAVAQVIFDNAALPELARKAEAHVDPPPQPAPEQTELRRRAFALTGQAGPCARPRDGVCASVKRPRLARAFVLLFECDLQDGTGRPASRELIPLRVQLDPRLLVTPSNVAPLVTLLSSSEPVRAILAQEMNDRRSRLTTLTGDSAAALHTRCVAIEENLSATPPRLIQSSLFDRRAEQQAHTRTDALARLREHLQHHSDRARALRSLTTAEDPRLIAAWAVEDPER